MELHVITFKNTLSAKVLGKLHSKNKYFLNSNESENRLFVRNFNSAVDGDYVLGIGDYSGTDRDKLRIETVCKNKFRNKNIISDYQNLEISQWISPKGNVKPTNGIGNSYCNLLSYLFALKYQSTEVKYGFIHIPKGFDIDEAKRTILNLIEQSIH